MTQAKSVRLTKGQIAICLILFPILNALFWAFAGAFGWALGYLAGWGFAGDFAAKIGSVAGLGLTLGVIVAVSSHVPVRVTAYVNLGLVCAGGVAIGGVVAWLLLHEIWAVAVGYLIGFVIAPYTVFMRQFVPSSQQVWRMIVGVIAGAVIGIIGWLVGGIAGWTAGGAAGLLLVRVLGEGFRKQPIVIVDKDEQPIRELTIGDRCQIVARECPRWIIRGALAGLCASAIGHWFVTSGQSWQTSALEFGKYLLPSGGPVLQSVLEIILLPMALAVITITRLMAKPRSGRNVLQASVDKQ